MSKQGMVDHKPHLASSRANSIAFYKQQAVLERIALGAPLTSVLDQILAIVQEELPELISSILVLDREGKHLHLAASRGLPQEYNDAIEGVRIGPNMGSCGTAAYLGEPVWVADIETDPLWTDFAHLALRHGLRACWSFPMRSGEANQYRIIGTFAIYSRASGLPDTRLLEVLSRFQSIASIAVESANNLSELKRTEQTLRESEEDFRATFEQAAVGISHVLPNGRLIRVNNRLAEITGYSKQQLLEFNYLDITFPEDRDLGRTKLKQILAGELATYAIEKRYVKSDGSTIWVNLTVSLRRAENGEPLHLICVIEDISRRKAVEYALRESERRLAEAQRIAQMGSWIWNPTTNQVTWSDSIYDLFGLTKGQIEPGLESFLKLLHPDDRGIALDRVEGLMRGGNSFANDMRLIRPDGECIWIHSRAKVTRDENGAILRVEGTDQDITRRKNTEIALNENQQFSAAIIEATPECITVYDESGRILEMNSAGLAMLEATSISQVQNRSLFEFIVPDQLAQFHAVHAHIKDSDRVLLEFDIIGLNGTCKSLSGQAVSVELRGKRVQLAVLRDNTERNQAQEALRLARFTIDRASVQVFWVRPDATIADVNEAAWSSLGYSREELLCMRIWELDLNRPQDSWQDHWNELRQKGTLRFGGRQVRKDGSILDVEISANWLIFEGSELNCAFVSDVSAQKKAETTLQASERRLRAIGDNLPGGAIFQYQRWPDQTHRLLYCSEGSEEILGIPATEMIANLDVFFHLIPAEELPQFEQKVAHSIANLSVFDHELYVRARSGELKCLHMRGTPHRDGDGSTIWNGVVVEVTQQKLAEKAKQASEERYRLAIHATNDLIWDFDPSTGVVHWSERFQTIFGEPEHLEKSLSWWTSRIHPHQREHVTRSLLNAVDGAESFWACDYRLQKKDGRWADIQDRAYISRAASGKCKRVVGAMQDVTDKKRAEQQQLAQHLVVSILAEAHSLKEAATRLLQTICQTTHWETGELWTIDSELQQLTNLEFWQDSDFDAKEFEITTRQSRFTKGEGLPGRVWKSGRNSWIVNISTDPNSPRADLAQRSGLRSAFAFPIQFNGDVLGVATFFSCQEREPEEGLLRMFESLGSQIGQFIERKTTEEDLRLFRMLIDRTTEFVEVIDHKTGRFLDVNQRACEAHGYSREEYLRLSVFDIDPDITEEMFKQSVQDHTEIASHTFETRHRRKDGTIFPVEVTANYVALERAYLVAVVRDITDRKALEEKIRQSQKMEAIGRLAGGIAHDFNNLLTVINGDSDFLLSNLPEGSPYRDSLAAIHEAGERAASLTAQLLAFSRKAVVTARPIHLNDVLGRDARILQRMIGTDIRLEIHTDPGIGWIRADLGQIEQVLINLVANARDAMPHGGTLRIETQLVSEFRAASQVKPVSGPGVLLSVTDTGHGISDEAKQGIFEPFFTTKEVGKGTGLGLAVVHGIVTQCGGQIHVESQVGVGTTFRIYFPSTPAPPEPTRPLEPTLQPTGSEMILLVDDEPSVRRVIQAGLEANGYHVISTGEVDTAIQVLEDPAHAIDILVTDIVMPNCSGRLLATKARKIRPDLKVVYMSGYTTDSTIQSELDESNAVFLRKPFSAESLGCKIREMLRRSS